MNAQEGTASLRAEKVTKDFVQRAGFLRKKETTRVLDDVSLEIHRDAIVGLVGDSGGGKTTLAKMLCGMLPPTSGQVFFGGDPLYGANGQGYQNARKRVRYIFQNVNAPLNPRMKIIQSLEEPIDVHSPMSAELRQRRIEEVAHEVDLPLRLLHKYPHALSGGEKRRVALARALACRPHFVIADEPTAGLDADLRDGLLLLLQKLRDLEHIGVLIISHDFHALATICDDVKIIVNGKLV